MSTRATDGAIHESGHVIAYLRWGGSGPQHAAYLSVDEAVAAGLVRAYDVATPPPGAPPPPPGACGVMGFGSRGEVLTPNVPPEHLLQLRPPEPDCAALWDEAIRRDGVRRVRQGLAGGLAQALARGDADWPKFVSEPDWQRVLDGLVLLRFRHPPVLPPGSTPPKDLWLPHARAVARMLATPEIKEVLMRVAAALDREQRLGPDRIAELTEDMPVARYSRDFD